MEKLDLQSFRKLRQEVIDIMAELRKINEGIYIQEEEKLFSRYKEIIYTLSQYDLSDIDFEEWRGMVISDSYNFNIDFSKTKANLDFSIVEYSNNNYYPIFKNCQVKNFDFDRNLYIPDMFDEKFIMENSERFLSPDIEPRIADKFYSGRLSLTEIKNSPELCKKVREKNISTFLRDLYQSIGKEEFLKLDAEFIDAIQNYFLTEWRNPIESNQNLKTAEEIMPILYGWERDKILTSAYYPYADLGETFKKLNPDLFLSDEVPKYIRDNYYHKSLSLREFSQYLKFFEGKKVSRNFSEFRGGLKLANLYGEDIYDLYVEYKPILDIMWNFMAFENLNIPEGTITEEERKKIMRDAVYLCFKDTNRIQNLSQLKMIMDFVSFEDLWLANKEQNKQATNMNVLDKSLMLEEFEADELQRIFTKYGERRIPRTNIVDVAQYILKNFGEEELKKVFSDYGDVSADYRMFLIDMTRASSKLEEITIDTVREVLEESIYRSIKRYDVSYSEKLPLSFKEKHPDLFLPEEIDEKLRDKFYNGELSFEDIRQNPQIKEILLEKDISVGFRKTKYPLMPRLPAYNELLGHKYSYTPHSMWTKFTEQEIMELAIKYGEFLDPINDDDAVIEGKTKEEIERAIQNIIEENILNRISPYNETIPEFFKQKHPEMFLDKNAPEELKSIFYEYEKSVNGNNSQSNSAGNGCINFSNIKQHPEWLKFLEGKDLSRAFPKEYSELFKRFDSNTLMKLGMKNTETISIVVQNHKESALENWYKSTGGRFLPHHVVVLNFPEEEIDSFLESGKKWSQLMRIDNYSLNDDGKSAILKAAYTMGAFKSDNDGFNKTMRLFTDVPQTLTAEEYEEVIKLFSNQEEYTDWDKNQSDPHLKDKKRILFERVYTLNDDGKYVFSLDKQKNKGTVKEVRDILEKAHLPRILTPEKAHQMFDSFAMKYNPDFVRFFSENAEEIISNPELVKDIASIQRQFEDIVKVNAGRRITLDVVRDYIKSISYIDVEVGNEGVAEQAKIAGYSQEDFEQIQKLFNEGETREYSSIPRIQGKADGYTYEMLRCDDPLALTIGTLTDCCQEIHGAGQTSMEHSVVSPDGRVFCVRDDQGRIVAQSWFWRNAYTGCFDNIEIPARIFEMYEKEHPDIGRKGLASEVLEVYKKAAQDLMQEDEKVYKELLEKRIITYEQYNALLLRKVTIGLGYNDIASAIESDGTIHQESDIVRVKSTDRLLSPYTDANIQYTIAEKDGNAKAEYDNLYVHEDDIAEYDENSMSNTLLLTMKRMEQSSGRSRLSYLDEENDVENTLRSQKIIKAIAEEYDFEPQNTRVMATARIAIIYSKDEDNKIKIGDILSSPLKEDLTEEQKQKGKKHIRYQMKKALKQLGVQSSEVDLSSLSEDQRVMLESVIAEMKNEKDER